MTAQVIYSSLFGLLSGAAFAWLLANQRTSALLASLDATGIRADEAERRADTAESNFLAANIERLDLQRNLEFQTTRASDVEHELSGARTESRLVKECLSAVSDELNIQRQRTSATERDLAVTRKMAELHENESRYHKGEHAYYKELSQHRHDAIEVLRSYILEFDELLTEAEAREAFARVLERLSSAVKTTHCGLPAPHQILLGRP